MALKDILVLTGEGDSTAPPYAASLASLCGAHLTGAIAVPDPLPGAYRAELSRSLLEQAAETVKRTRAEVEATFRGLAQTRGIAAETVVLDGRHVSVSKNFAMLARHFDLSVLPQPGVEWFETHEDILFESALFRSGRPVLVVPSVHRAPATLERIMVAWDGSEVATRAIAGAMPLLERARSVLVVTIPTARYGAVDYPGFNIARHLARHGLPVELKVTPSTIDAGNTLLSLAADEGSDLLVMGAYGHSRMRELVLGGATRQVLATMTLPVLMAH